MCNSKYIYECIECKAEFKTNNRSMDGAICPSCRGKILPLRVEDCINHDEIVTHAKYKCLSCNHTDLVRGKRQEYQEIRLCPACNGLYVDAWKLTKYEHLKSNHGSYLQITLDEPDSVPRVFYKGKEINLKQEVLFHWETDTDIPGGTTIEIEFAQEGCGYPKSKKVAERLKSHMKY